MRDPTAIRRRSLSTIASRLELPIRSRPYFTLLSYCRHLGYHKLKTGRHWVARYRTIEGSYRQFRLGTASDSCDHLIPGALTFDQAKEVAQKWFEQSNCQRAAAQPRPMGVQSNLVISPIGEIFTIGHALSDYVEWKRLSAAKSHFQTNVSLINHHIIPRLASVPVNDFNGGILRQFILDVLETPPKRGNQPIGERRKLEALDEEALRKRKKTVNTLIGILRLSFQLAWEGGKLENERAVRCLRNLPVVDRPRVLHLNRDECCKLLGNCREDIGRFVLGALYTGCRATELVRMRCSHVGRDGYGVYVTPVKKYRSRFVFLPDEAMIWFLELTRNRNPNDFVFLRGDGKPWFDRSYRYSFQNAVAASNLPDDFVFHGLRHTYASQLIQAGATIFAVADQLGHTDPTTVLRTYGHLSPQIRESEVRQRFTPLNRSNVELASEKREYLRNWRRSISGSDHETYARILDLRYTNSSGQLGS